MLEALFSHFGLNESETKTYLALLQSGSMQAGKLATVLQVPRSSVYDFLHILAQKGLVRQGQKQGVKIWVAEPPEKITALINEQLASLEETKKNFLKLLPDLQATRKLDFSIPKFQYFEGKEGVRQALKDMLLYREIETQAFWPIRDMIEILGKDFFVYLNVERIRRKLFTQALWPVDKVVNIEENAFLGVGPGFYRQVRTAPPGIESSMGYWAYADKVVCISSRQESFAFIVESKEFRQMLKGQFDMIWALSEKIEVDQKMTKQFLEENHL